MTGATVHDQPIVLTSRASLPDVEYAEYKLMRDKLEHSTLPRLAPAVQASTFPTLDGLPYPIKFRNRGALEEWRRLFAAHHWSQLAWDAWAQAPSTCLDCIHELRWQVEQQVAVPARNEYTSPWSDVVSSNVVKWAANIHYERKCGALIETTPALDALLLHSDLDGSVPMRMFSPPFRAQYLRLHRSTAEQLASPEDRAKQCWIDGVFCFVSRPEPSCHPAEFVTVIELVTVYSTSNQRISAHMLRGPVIAPDESVTHWADAILSPQQGKRTAQDDVEVKLINYMAKVFLYLGLKDARKQIGADHSTALKRLAAVGPKKQAKLQRRLESVYDRITVGPASMPAPLPASADAATKAPHWRRGHFRCQPCGPARTARKLIFVAPILIHADRLGNDVPRPKAYALTPGGPSISA